MARRGPISVVIHVVSPMYSYSSGIFNEPNRCSNTTYNHAVVSKSIALKFLFGKSIEFFHSRLLLDMEALIMDQIPLIIGD